MQLKTGLSDLLVVVLRSGKLRKTAHKKDE